MIDTERLEKIIKQFYDDEVKDAKDITYMNHGLIDQYYPDYADKLIDKYEINLQHLERAFNTLTNAQNTQCKIRLYNVQNKIPIHQVHQKHRGQLVSIEGDVTKTTEIFNQITEAAYHCNNCSKIHYKPKNYDEKIKNTYKGQCPRCGHTSVLDLIPEESVFEDMQIITVQEKRDDAKNGYKPTLIQCIFREDMVQTVKPGDKVTINGIVELRNKNQNNLFTEYIDVKNCTREEDDYDEMEVTDEEIRQIIEESKKPEFFDKFYHSIAPSISGNDEVKEAIMLQMFSSNEQTNTRGETNRGDIHLLLVGDPGLGKSQILKYVANVAPRATYTSGKSSTGAGLTASAVRDVNDSWTLEAGAMVLADKGVLCIDEFDKMSENDRSSIHEALEQQTISVAKAGLTTTLDSRCSVLAAANPKFGSFNPYSNKTLSEQINLNDTILSRFDLIFVMKDSLDNDTNVVESIYNSYQTGDDDSVENTTYDRDFMTKYIAYARRLTDPELTREILPKMNDFYRNWRRHNQETNSGTPVTPRQIAALIRLTKASARARLSQKVEEEDLERAIRLEQYCINQFEAQLVDQSTEQVGYKEDLDDEKTYDAMKVQVERLARDYDNIIPANTMLKALSELGLSKEFIRRWLKTMDSMENMVFNVDEQTWSCMGSWWQED